MPFVEVNGCRLHYVDRGQGAPLVLGHGLCMDQEMFAAQVESLSLTYRVIALDWRGHGESDAPAKPYTMEDQADDLYQLLTQLGLSRAHIGGMSMGGMIAMRFALAHPEMTESLILIDTDAGPESAMKRVQFGAMAAFMRYGLGELVIDKAVRLLFGEHFRRTEPERARHWRSRILAQSPVGLYYATRCVTQRSDVRELVGRIQAPTLILCGEDDTATTPDKSEFLVRTIPNAKLVMIPDAGHSSPVEQPAAITEAMARFLAPISHGRA